MGGSSFVGGRQQQHHASGHGTRSAHGEDQRGDSCAKLLLREDMFGSSKGVWLLLMADSIIELTPSIQELPDSGSQFEIMVPHPSSDLYTYLLFLKKLHAILLAMIDVYIGSKPSKMYADAGLLSDTRKIFDEMTDQDCILLERADSALLGFSYALPTTGVKEHFLEY